MTKTAPNAFNSISFLLITAVVMLSIVGAYLFSTMDLTIFPGKDTITVSGVSRSYEQNNIATFNATVSVTNADKETAVREMNEKVSAITEGLLSAGISKDNFKTSNLSIYRDQIWNEQTQTSEQGDWRATTSIEIRLDDVDKANEVSTILASMDITEVYGPNLVADSINIDESQLLMSALEDAHSKAESMAWASNRKLGKMISMTEVNQPGEMPYMMEPRMMGGGGGVSIDPGTSSVYKYVTVTYLLR